MEATKKLKIECPYEILKIEDIKILCKPNEHGKVYLKCLIDDSVNFKYSIEASTNDKICVYEEIENTDLNNNENKTNEEKRTIIFYGIIDNIKTTNINGIYYLELEGSSSSSLLDIEKRTRSFQDINMSYDELINEILKNYEGYGFTQCMSRPMSIEKPLFQYKETDYEFLKRIGSYLGLELICDVVNTNNIIYFGKPSLKFYALNNEINYKASKDLEKYYKVLTLGTDFHDTDFFYYEVMLREKMNIGDLIKFKERDFYVNQYYGQMHNRELIYKYRFCRKNGIWQEKIYNEKLKGISIEGKVLAVDGERVKLHLNIDETQDISKASWFKYAPPTGNIMYAMPNIGESVMLYFPNRYDEPIVTGCVRKNGSSCSKISNTNNRYFSTESGNNLDILPGAINFYRSGMNVNLNDENGVNISSSGNLSLGASGGISLSGGSVSISGSNKILVQKNKSSYISLEGECYNQSNAVYENGSCRETYEPFTDDDPQNGVAEALAELEYKNELLSLSILGSNVMLNVVMQNDKINKMPKTYKGIPMAGSDLEKRMDIATFDATKKYKEGTMVKFKSLDGEYILGEAGKSAPCAGGVSAFKAYDKSSYKGHNSPKDAIKSMGYGALDFVNTSLDSTSDLAFDACKYVMTRGIIDESTNNKIGNSFDWLKEQKGKPSDLLHEHFKNESPHKETFEATKIGLDMLTLLDSGIGAASYCGKLSRIKKLNAAEKVANSKKAENILNELNKEILGVNKGISNAKNIDELFTTNEIKNLKSTVIEEGQMLKDMKWGKRKIYNDELGPAIAGVYNKRNGRIYTAINDMDGEIPTELSKTIGKRIENMPDDVLDLYIEHTKGAGSHAEVYAANKALLDDPNATLDDLLVYVNRTLGTSKPVTEIPFKTCPHCEYILDGFHILSNN
ncbi:hypothetical protein FDF12_14995 [Clostridium botulinum]|nr:hypothetical protein [Clostridium botulinum]NFS55204.1 hypothetical protein [Clostridium botulinum]NFT18641.1 hypothetical protein [Clostridium botulinum]